MARIGIDKDRISQPQHLMQSALQKTGSEAQRRQDPTNATYQANGTTRRKESPVNLAQQGSRDYWLAQRDNEKAAGGAGGAVQDPYAAQANALYQQLLNRGPFRYDLQGDLLYRQYADQYSMLGQQAMKDAMGTAAGLTGGYGNSYAAQVGSQAYQQYLGQLNGMIPEFYDRAYQAWLNQGDDMLMRYQLAQERSAASRAGANRPEETDETDEEEEQQSSNMPDGYYGYVTGVEPGMSFADFAAGMPAGEVNAMLQLTPEADMALATQWQKYLKSK